MKSAEAQHLRNIIARAKEFEVSLKKQIAELQKLLSDDQETIDLPIDLPEKPPKKLPKDLIVTIDDRSVIEGVQWKVFIDAIEEADIGKVHAHQFRLRNQSRLLTKLKDRNEPPGTGYREDSSGHYAIYTTYSAEDKKYLLDAIAKKLNLQWRVEIVERERK